MRVVWVSFAPLRKTAAGLTSDLASVRYRLTIPAQAIPGSRVTYFGPGANRRTLLERFAGADAVVLGKLEPSLAQAAVELAEALRKSGLRIIADFSDDHFLHPVVGPAYRALANAVEAAVASTPELAEVVRSRTQRPVSVVTDPVEGARGEPSAALARPLRLLWFGHPLNLDTLPFGLSQLEKVDFSLTIVTSPGMGAENLGHRFRPWSTEAVFEELRQCDAVIIPSNPHDPRKAVKSPNRFTESLWAGRFVVAHPLPAYAALAAYGWVDEHLGEGIAWLLEHFEEARERVRSGQQVVAREFSPQAIGRAWEAVITQT